MADVLASLLSGLVFGLGRARNGQGKAPLFMLAMLAGMGVFELRERRRHAVCSHPV